MRSRKEKVVALMKNKIKGGSGSEKIDGSDVENKLREFRKKFATFTANMCRLI